jgi:hypothetical protein
MIKTTDDPSLSGFEQRLLSQLREVVVLRATAENSARAPKRKALLGGLLERRGSLAAAGAVALAACAVLLGLSAGTSPQPAQAFPIFATPTVNPSGILESFLKSEGMVPGNPPDPTKSDAGYWREAARHAHAFSTYWGAAYTLETYDKRDGYTVCTIYPDYQTPIIPDHGGWVGGCSTASTLAEAVEKGPAILQDPHGVEFVELVPAGATATLTYRDGPSVPVSITNGTLSVRVTRHATLRVRSRDSTTVYHLNPGGNACSGQVEPRTGLAGLGAGCFSPAGSLIAQP